MRIIYEDGDYRNEKEQDLSQQAEDFVDISSVSEEYKENKEQQDRAGKPYRPAATLRPTPLQKEKDEIQQEAAQPYPWPYPPQPYPPYPQQYMQYPQPYPVQYVPVGYPPQQMYMPGVQYGHPTGTPNAAPQGNGMPDAGTRVLYQSPDFDKKESEAPAAGSMHTVGRGITHVDVELPRTERVSPTAPKGSFEVDDMEMSVFELNSLSHKYNTKARAFRKPDESDGTLEIEEYDESFGYYEDFDSEEDEAATKPEKKKKPSGKKRRSETVRKIVLAISIIAIVVSCVVLINEARLSKENEKVMEEVSDLIIDTDSLIGNDETDEGNESDESDKTDGGEDEPVKETEEQLTPEQQWAKVKEEFPNVVFPSDIQLKYARLYGTNREFVGYLSAEGVNLSLPVVQTDNDETYLNKNFYGKNTKYGCPFVTHLNNIGSERDSLDMNTVIFGHYMKDGSVFGNLFEYKDIDGFKAAPVITFNTLYHDYSWKVIAAFITNADEKDDNGYIFKYYFTDLSTQERYSAYLSELSQRSIYDTGVDVLPGDKILTLSTCSYEFDNARFVVVARLVRNGESTEVDTSKATVNPSPRYPQAYYDKKKLDNPYKDAYRWEVG